MMYCIARSGGLTRHLHSMSAFGLAVVFLLGGLVASASAQEAEWIWSPDQQQGSVPAGSCYFRKSINVRTAEAAQLVIAADDSYEVRINGRLVGSGSGAKRMVEYDIARLLSRGKNLIAIRVSNTGGGNAGLVARVMVKEAGGGWNSFSTDSSWKCNLNPLPLWDTSLYNDSRWADAKSLGRLGETVPWDREAGVAVEETDRNERFRISPEFTVQRIVDSQDTGSLISMAFNEFGQVVASREGGPLLILYDSDKDQQPDKSRVYCDKVKNCQGILPLNGDVFVTADGPEGAGLYRLSDPNRDGTLEEAKLIVKFKGTMGEHGPHAVTIGPDGLLYVMLGNLTAVDGTIDDASPHRNFYEGDIVPRYEDPGGHALGVKAPGGVVVRTDTNGSVVQLFAGGIRNAYDMVFTRDGELFTHDSDMETDEGTPWFRPTQMFHIVPGGEYGWRSGWARWPEHFVDNLPPTLDTGRGSPTGAVAYNHFAFPIRYQNVLFTADWTQGRILAVRLKKNGGSYTATSETFLEGDPLNVTDLDVGPDGALYFVTGGRGTAGGLYRVAWRGKVPKEFSDLGDGISAVIRQPQMNSAWGRQRIARAKSQLGVNWERLLEGVARSTANPAEYRVRALDVMQLFGPPPTGKLLLDLSQDKSEAVRSRSAELMGLHANDATGARLVELLGDPDRMVRRHACESLVRAKQPAQFGDLKTMLASDDRFEAFAARRLLEQQPVEEWRDALLAVDDQRTLIQGALALLTAAPDRDGALAVVAKIREMSKKFVSDRNFVDMLRVIQVAIHRGQLAPADLADVREWLSEEFPAGDPTMNQELVRILVFLQVGDITDRYVEYIKGKAKPLEKMHIALYLRFIEEGWKPDQRLVLIDHLEKIARTDVNTNLPVYVRNAARDMARNLSEDEGQKVLEKAVDWPNAALGILFRLPNQLGPDEVAFLTDIDRKLVLKNEDSAKPLLVGLIAVLARSGDPTAMEYLREVWLRDPERRQSAAIGLAQQPDGPNWDILVRSLSFLEGPAAIEVMNKLLTVEDAPAEPEYLRQLILRGLALKDQGGDKALALLEHWAEEPVSKSGDSWDKGLAAWQDWYRKKYPTLPPPVPPAPEEDPKWKYDELLEYLTSGEGHKKGSAARGVAIFTKAQCVKCHRHGKVGEQVGPDLSTVSKRFMRKEILESIIYPSHVISDQYAAHSVITLGGKRYTGMITPGAPGERIVLQSNGEKVSIRESDIDEIVRSPQSSMPTGLINNLTLDEITDLFAFLTSQPNETFAKNPADSTTKRR